MPIFTTTVILKYKIPKERDNVVDFFENREFSVTKNNTHNFKDIVKEKYRLKVDQNLLNVYGTKNKAVYDILKDLVDKAKKYQSYWISVGDMKEDDNSVPISFKASMSRNLLSDFERLFISTLVYFGEKQNLPSNVSESMVLEFDTNERTVTLKDIYLHSIDDNCRFLKFLRNIAGRNHKTLVFR